MCKQLALLAFACIVAGCHDRITTFPDLGITLPDFAVGTGGNDVPDLAVRDLAVAGADMRGGGGSGGSGDGGAPAPPDLADPYPFSTIATMRAGGPGGFTLANVTVLGVTGSTARPVLYVRDPIPPADLTAIAVKCDGLTSAHPCSVATALHGLTRGQSVTVKGTYIKTSGFEEFYLDGGNLTAGAAGSAPQPRAVQLGDVQRNNSLASQKNWFQYVTVSNPGTLDVYDLTPSELVFIGAIKCPYQTGFGLIPDGTAGYAAPAACSGTTQPPVGFTPASANVAELLIGTDFYSFTISSDCACAANFQETLVTPTMKTTALAGILVPASVYMSSPTIDYQYIDPISPADLPLQ